MEQFSLFVYGSLKTDGEHHDVVAPYLVGTQKALLPGSLFQRDDGYWSARDVRACWMGSGDTKTDIGRLASTTAVGRVDHEFDLHNEPSIEGEVLHLSGGPALLEKLDRFEGFDMGKAGEANDYLRVAVRVNLGAHQQPCFCYIDAQQPTLSQEPSLAPLDATTL